MKYFDKDKAIEEIENWCKYVKISNIDVKKFIDAINNNIKDTPKHFDFCNSENYKLDDNIEISEGKAKLKSKKFNDGIMECDFAGENGCNLVSTPKRKTHYADEYKTPDGKYDFSVGTKFIYKGKKYLVTEQYGCKSNLICSFFSDCKCRKILCASMLRNDRKNIIFKEIPYIDKDKEERANIIKKYTLNI